MTKREEWQRAKELFGAAIEQDRENRSAFLDGVCGPTEGPVRRQVEELLAAHQESEGFLATPAAFLGGVPDPQSSLLTEGKMVGRYRLLGLLGAGGMGQVYLAEDPRLERKVALKLLPRHLAADADRLRRFEQEARTASGLSHPNVCVIYEIGDTEAVINVAESRRFIAMEYVPGDSLRHLIDRHSANGTRLALPVALEIAHHVAKGLEAAHAAGVVHRDIKPENIMVRPDGLVKVLDFGLAKLTEKEDIASRGPTSLGSKSVHTEPGMVLGTVQYMSPEQARGLPVDGRADIWSLGAVLYEMLAGRPPFVGETGSDVMVAVLGADPPLLSSLGLVEPEAVQRIVDRALTKDREQRYQSSAEISNELGALQRDIGSNPVGDSQKVDTSRLRRSTSSSSSSKQGAVNRRMRKSALVVIGLIVAATIASLALFNRGDFSVKRAPKNLDQKYVVAVLPFENLSADTATNYIAAGMTEEIAGQLSQLSALRVLTRAAVAPYRGTADRLLKLDKELGVGSVVEGSVRIDRDRARIAVQLVDARSGQAIWSQQYDRSLDDMLAVESEVGRSITTALEATLTPAEARRAGRPPTVDVAAYQLYTRSLTQAPDASVKTLKRAIEADSTFATAYAHLARMYLFMSFQNRAYLDTGLTAARKAISLDPESAYGYFALGGLQTFWGRLKDSRESFLKAHALDPNLFGALADLSLTEYYLGRYDESLHWSVRSFPLAPRSAIAYYHLSLSMLSLGTDEANEALLLRAERLFPDESRIQMGFSMLDFDRGRSTAAVDRARRMVERDPDKDENQRLFAELAFLTGAPNAETLLEAIVKVDPRATPINLPEAFGAIYGLSLARRGLQARADSLWTEALTAAQQDVAAGDENGDRRVEIAAISAVRGDTAAAVSWLERGYIAGWRDYRALAHDPFFDRMRSNVGFQQITERMKADVAAMRQRAIAANDTLFSQAGRRSSP